MKLSPFKISQGLCNQDGRVVVLCWRARELALVGGGRSWARPPWGEAAAAAGCQAALLHPRRRRHCGHEDLWQRGEPEEAGMACARLHPPCLVLLRRLPSRQLFPVILSPKYQNSCHQQQIISKISQPLGLTSMPGHGNNNDYNDESLYEIINLQDDPQVRVQTQLRIVHGPQWMDLNGQWFMKFEVIKLARLTKRSITSTKGLNVVFPVGISVRVRSEAKNHTWTGKSQWAHTQVGWSMLLFVLISSGTEFRLIIACLI